MHEAHIARELDVTSTPIVRDHVVGFDLLRGICAIAVAAYHVLAWNDWAHLYTWGTYTVYIFFALSGASMWVAYADRFERGFSLARFLALRLLRLAPLYLLGLVLTLAYRFQGEGLDANSLALAPLNVFFQFGLGNPGATSQVVGGWSLGIEFVFYLLFPVFLALLSGRWWLLVLMGSFASQHLFIASIFSNGRGMTESFAEYTQFLAFAFYFAAGCAVGRAIQSGTLRSHWIGAPLMVGSIAVLASVSGAAPELTLAGFAGISLSLLAALAVASAAVLTLGSAGTWVAGKLGKASYGVYILHPFVVGFMQPLPPLGVVVGTVAISILLALVLERWFERPIQTYFKHRKNETIAADPKAEGG